MSSQQKKKVMSSPQKKKAISSPSVKKAISSPSVKKAICSPRTKKVSSKSSKNKLVRASQTQPAALETENPLQSGGEAICNTEKRKRGINTMQRIVKRKVQGVRKVVEYNTKGQPRGKTAKELQSYIGVLARTKVRIDIKKWKAVELDTKKKILEAVEMAFVIAPHSRKMILRSAACKWREFKSRLTNTYVYPYEDEAEVLCDPPEEYPFIEADAWKAFVAHRFTEDFRALHKKQQSIRSQNQYNHRLSRKGYVGLEDELLDKMAAGDIDRATLWRKAREDKHGNITDEKTAEKVKEIDEFKKKVDDGSLTEDGSHDILTMALGTSERPGRVRGVGGYVTPTTYFQIPRCQREYVSQSIKQTVDKLLEEERDKMQVMAAKLVADERDFWLQKIIEIESRLDGKCTAKVEPTPAGHNLTPPALDGGHFSDKASCSAAKKN